MPDSTAKPMGTVSMLRIPTTGISMGKTSTPELTPVVSMPEIPTASTALIPTPAVGRVPISRDRRRVLCTQAPVIEEEAPGEYEPEEDRV